ncbi:MAG: hypothetical protein HXL37_06200 [Riemerella sp.]|nr:hypothetical protein [Riemerella sp.]
MKTKELKIEVPDGYEIDREKSTFEKIVFKKRELPKSWEELHMIKGWFVENGSGIYEFENCFTISKNRNLFPTKEEAEACVALAQLCQLRDRYNDGWKPDWKDFEEKFNIFYSENKIVKGFGYISSSVLTFKTKELRDKFLENFRNLIETAKPLL